MLICFIRKSRNLTLISVFCRNYAPTAQVASQQGKYLARVFNQLAKKEELELALEEARHSPAQAIDME